MIKQAKRQNKKMQMMILANKDKTVKGSVGEKEDKEALESFKVSDQSDNKMNLFLFSKQVDQLYSAIDEFDGCFQYADSEEMKDSMC